MIRRWLRQQVWRLWLLQMMPRWKLRTGEWCWDLVRNNWNTPAPQDGDGAQP